MAPVSASEPVAPTRPATASVAAAPLVTAPPVSSCSVLAWLVSVTASPALPMLIALVLPRAPIARVVVVIPSRKSCDSDNAFGLAAEAPISSIGRPGVSGSNRAKSAVIIPAETDGLPPARSTESATTVAVPPGTCSALIVSNGEAVVNAKLPSAASKSPIAATLLVALVNAAAPEPPLSEGVLSVEVATWVMLGALKVAGPFVSVTLSLIVSACAFVKVRVPNKLVSPRFVTKFWSPRVADRPDSVSVFAETTPPVCRMSPAVRSCGPLVVSSDTVAPVMPPVSSIETLSSRPSIGCVDDSVTLPAPPFATTGPETVRPPPVCSRKLPDVVVNAASVSIVLLVPVSRLA